MTRGKRIALALGSGGARGYAHIGVIAAVRERGHEIVAISGSSMGALVGGLEAVGRLDPFTEWARGLTQRDVLRLVDLTLSGPGAMRAEKVLAKVDELLAGARIEHLPIPYTAVATDVASRKAVWFQHGPVDIAIRASVAIPGLITPVLHNGRILADGGMVDPVPMEPITAANADVTIGVSLTGMRTLAALAPTEQPPDMRPLDVLMLSLDTMFDLINRYRMASNPPDIAITVPADACGTMDFHRAAELIELGHKLTTTALDNAGL